MLGILITKEFKNIIQSPKFVSTFLTCTVLILLSVYIGIQEYNDSVRQYEIGNSITEQSVREQTAWGQVQNQVFRKPSPLQIFVSGINNDIGRLTTVSEWQSIKLRNSHYSDNPVFAVFRFIDLTFIFMIVMSLFAIIFTYDAVNGEREGGTLKLVFSNSVSRAKFLMAKFIGSWVGLVIPVIFSLLLGLLMLILFNIELSSSDWISIISLLGISILFFTFFICLGLCISSLTPKSSTSFMVLLVLWIAIVLILPRIGIMIAGEVIHVPTIAETESKKEGYNRERWDRFSSEMSKVWEERNREVQSISSDENAQRAYRDSKEWEWLEKDDEVRKKVNAEIAEYSRKLSEDLRNAKALQEELGLNISRFSPASSYLLASMNLSGSDIGLKSRYETALEDYKKTYSQFVQQKQKESGQSGGIRISMDSRRGFSFQTDEGTKMLNPVDMPKFVYNETVQQSSFGLVAVDVSLLLAYSLIAFFVAFLLFLKYDVR